MKKATLKNAFDAFEKESISTFNSTFLVGGTRTGGGGTTGTTGNDTCSGTPSVADDCDMDGDDDIIVSPR